MIKLYQFPAHFGVPNMSPFCMKLECFLRMTELDYETVTVQRPEKAPKGKCPYIVDGAGEMGDSELIMDHLVDTYGKDPDQGLDDGQRAVSRAFQAMLDERLYWVLVYSRWLEPALWPQIRAEFFAALPLPLRGLVSLLVRRGIRRQLWQQGMGRHQAEEVYGFGVADLRALATQLGDREYFHGDRPTRIDACVLSHTANILIPGHDSPLLQELGRQENLCAYTWRMMARYFPEYVPAGRAAA